LSVEPWTSSEKARERVTQARERQARRLREECVTVNAHMDARMLERHSKLDEEGRRMLGDAQAKGKLSARGQHRTLRVARTIADLNGCERVRMRDVGVALSLRPETGLRGSRAA
jgi:magnesium chelatase family protein